MTTTPCEDSLLTELIPSRGIVPFTHRYLSLRLKLDFQKRRLCSLKIAYDAFLKHRPNRQLIQVLEIETAFQKLGQDIKLIEENHVGMKRKAMPRVKRRLDSYQRFLVFLSGYQYKDSPISKLNQDKETTQAIKTSIAEYAGVPRGVALFDFEMLSSILQNEEIRKDDSSEVSSKVSSDLDLEEHYRGDILEMEE